MILSLDIETLVGMLMLSLAGTVVWAIRELPARLVFFLIEQTTVRVTVSSTDVAYDEAVRWLAESEYATKARQLQLKSHYSEDDDDAQWVLHPGMGRHIIFRGLRSVLVERKYEEQPGGSMLPPKERMTFRMLGRSTDSLRDLIAEIQAHTTEDGVVAVYAWQGWWKRIMRKRMRSIDTVVTEAGTLESVLADLQWFARSAEWYAHRGVPYRRGYLLTGPPGTGKTSLVQAIAGYLDRPVALLSLGSVSGDKSLMEAVLSAPRNAILLLEDVDCAQASESRSEKQTKISPDPTLGVGPETVDTVSLSGLLNAMDGVATPDGRIFMLTTNHPDKLDPALMRPGRADVRVELGYIGAEEIAVMARRFYGENTDVSLRSLPMSISPAAVQEAFMRHPDNADEALRLIATKHRDGPWR